MSGESSELQRIPVVDISPSFDACKEYNPDVREKLKSVSVNLYQKRDKIQPKSVQGIFQTLRKITLFCTMGGYVLIPWFNWQGKQAIHFDLPARQFHFFEVTFWPQDFVLLSWLLIIAAFSLFLVTALAGRVYCGYVCPQTVWTLFFLWIEKFTEGDRNARLKLDKAPVSMNKILRRGSKHVLWLLLAFLTGFTFVGYFYGIRELSVDFLTLSVQGWPLFWTLFFTATTYMNAGWMREQVCMYMCPYARFQSVMFDRNTLIVSYDEQRGEPRGKKSVDGMPLGDCVNCGLCVQVCPTGIDIRNGLQYECITCASCIDACDQVMAKLGRPKGLVRYTTENNLQGQQTHLLRPRIVGYATAVVVMGIAFLFVLFSRTPLKAELIRDRGALYQILGGDVIENTYTLKVYNMSQEDQTYTLTAEPDIFRIDGNATVSVRAGAKRTIPLSINAAFDALGETRSTLYIHVQSTGNPSHYYSENGTFLRPETLDDW